MDGESTSGLATLDFPGHVAPTGARKELFSELFDELTEETRSLLADPHLATLGVKTDSGVAAHAASFLGQLIKQFGKQFLARSRRRNVAREIQCCQT